MSNTILYALWGVLYALCAGLGFITAPGEGLKFLMSLLSVCMFVPPLVLNYRAAKRNDRRALQLVRNLAAAWLVLACVLLVANFLSVLASQTVGNVLYSLMTIVASPMVASRSWALAIFLWACVFFDAAAKLKKK